MRTQLLGPQEQPLNPERHFGGQLGGGRLQQHLGHTPTPQLCDRSDISERIALSWLLTVPYLALAPKPWITGVSLFFSLPSHLLDKFLQAMIPLVLIFPLVMVQLTRGIIFSSQTMIHPSPLKLF